MKEGWEEKKIGDVCTILNGGTPKTNVPEYWDGDVLWITPKDMGQLTSEYVSDTSRKISKLGLQKSSAKLIPINSIILSTRAPIGHLAINTKEITTNQGCRGLVPDEVLDTRYLYYFCCNSVERFNDLGSGTTFKELSKKALSSVIIPIPPLPEQKEIVKILDEAFSAIDEAKANIEKNIENARELFQSRLNEIFSRKGNGWIIKELKILSNIMYGHTAKSSGTFKGPKYLRITDIQDNHVDWNEVPNCLHLKDDYEKYELKCGDIVFARTGATTGKSFLIKKCPDAVFASYLIRVQPDQDVISPEFLYMFFQSPKYWRVIESGISGSAQGGFNAKKLGNLLIPIPPLSEQKEIVAKLDELNRHCKESEEKYQQKLTNLEELKKSLLQKAFAGELT